MVSATTKDRIFFRVKLTPNAARNEIKGWDKDSEGNSILKASVTCVPEDGKANAALIKLLAKERKIPKTSLTIEKGTTDRNKTLSIPQDYEACLPQNTN